jgi:rubredoxin
MGAGKVCEGFEAGKCKWLAVKGERYCPRCRAAMLRKMKNDGYFVDVPKSRADDTAADAGRPDHRTRYVPAGPWDGIK